MSIISRMLGAFRGRSEPKVDAENTLSFNPQVVRRMAQLEAELARLAESQHAARLERAHMSDEMAKLRAATQPMIADLVEHDLPEANSDDEEDAQTADIPTATSDS